MPQREILCIDDDVQSLQIRKILLETFDFRVTTAASAKEGLELFRSRHVAAVVLDYQMPEMNGGQVARQMKRLRPEVPVLMLSALPWLPPSAQRECIDMFMTKGGPTSKLVSELEQLIATAPVSARARVRGTRLAGAVLGMVAEKISGAVRTKPTASAKPLVQAPARTN